MRFLIAGGYSCGNPGDEAILKATVTRLHRLFAGSSFVIWTDADDFSPRMDPEVEHEIFYWKPLRWRRTPGFLPKLATKLYEELYPLSRWVLTAQSSFDRRVLRTLGGCDKIVFVGGGYINSAYCLMEMNYLAAVASRMRKPVALLGQTLGPFTRPKHQRMADDIFRGAQAIVLRDEASMEEVAGYSDKVWTGCDDALSFEPRLSERELSEILSYLEPVGPGGMRVGLSLRRWKGSRSHYARIARAFESFARTLDGRLEIVFIPMETSRWCDDRLEAAEFARHLPASIGFVSVQAPLTVEQTYHLIGQMDLLVGMRLHAMVFALSRGVPTIGLYEGDYYRRKISGLFASFDLRANLLSFDRLEELGPLMRSLADDATAVQSHLFTNRARMLTHQNAILERTMRAERAA